MIRHLFIPHKAKNKHKKAHLLSFNALAFYVVFFVFMQIGFSAIRVVQPGVLGTTSAITKQEIINLTNSDRQKNNAQPLKENEKLDQAAELKAKNMFEENYWAHVSPSGKDPWLWIQKAGYNYLFAGENLARSFSSSSQVESAWMASTMGHRENILNNRYQEIGVAVEDGVINGEKTTLVVQLFGTMTGANVKPQISDEGANTTVDNKIATNIPSDQSLAMIPQVKSAKTVASPAPSFLSQYIRINPYSITRALTFSLIAILTIIGLTDIIVLWKRKVAVNLALRHLPHFGLILASALILLIMRIGVMI